MSCSKKKIFCLLICLSYAMSQREFISCESHARIGVDRRAWGWNDGKNGEGESKNTWSMINAPTPITVQRHQRRRVPQNRATMRPLVTIMLKCNLLITAAAPSRSLISPICTAVGERKQNRNERPVPPGRMIRDKEGGIGDAGGMARRERERESARGRTMVVETGDTKRNKFRNR